MAHESDFHADYIFTEGLELANLEMARRISHLKRHQWSVHEEGGCEVSDDTGGVIPPTSASNLQHEKDTPATPYLPPAIHHCPSSCSVSLFHLNPKSNLGSRYQRFQPQFPIKHTQECVCLHLCCCHPASTRAGMLVFHWPFVPSLFVND